MNHLFSYLAIIAVFFLGDRFGGFLLQKQADASQFRYSRMYRNDARADVLLVGNSRGLTLFQPAIEEKTGLSTFNLSYNGLPMDLAKTLVEDYFEKNGTPRIVVIEITTCDRENDALVAGFMPFLDKSARLSVLLKAKNSDAFYGSQFSRLYRFGGEVFQRALAYRSKNDEDWLLDREISPKLAAEVSKNSYDLSEKIIEKLMPELAATVAFAKEKGSTVRLVVSPYFPKFEVKNLDFLKKAAEKATGERVFDFSEAIADPSCFGDFMHPNVKGARVYVDLMRRDAVLP